MTERCSFYALFEGDGPGAVSAVRVPRLQRDYAQGRTTDEACRIRDRFVNALFDALDRGQPLHLDFVYGIKRADVLDIIDGQQRLTTLFLLHWYLACTAGLGGELYRRLHLAQERRCRFSYEVRPSGSDFFRRLAEGALEVDPAAIGDAPSRWIQDQYWFAGLRDDPTVRGCLVMLDAIASRAAGGDSGARYACLTDSEDPGVTFSRFLLNARNLDEDVYVKLNARGLKLTAFDSFKVGFESLLAKQKGPGPSGRGWDQWRERIADGLDTTWGETIWSIGRAASSADPGETHSDDLLTILRQLAYLAALEVPLEDDLPPGEPSRVQALRDALRLADPANPAATAELDPDVLQPLLPILLPQMEAVLNSIPEALAAGSSTWFPADSLYRAFEGQGLATPGGTDRATFTDHAQLLGWFLFLRHHPGRCAEPEVAAELREWSRLVHHYTAHIELRRSDLDSVNYALGRMAEGVVAAGGVVAFAASDAFLDLFRAPRPASVDAEHRKARLLLADPAWRKALDPLEQHVLHRGDVDFLLRLAAVDADAAAQWTSDEHAAHRRELSRWADAAQIVFPDVEQDDRSFRLERTLLALGATLPSYQGVSRRVPDWGTRRYRWRDSVAVGARAQEESRAAIEALVRGWRRADEDATPRGYLESVLTKQQEANRAASDENRWESWREILIESPLALRYCCGTERGPWRRKQRRQGKRNIAFFRRRGERRIALQKTSSANGEKFDLFLYAFLGDLRGLEVTDYDPDPSDDAPWARFDKLGVLAEVHEGAFTMTPLDDDAADAFVPRTALSARQAARWLRRRARQVPAGEGESG